MLAGALTEVDIEMSKDLDAAIERYHRSADDFVKGNSEPMKDAFSHEGDVTLANPWGPFVRGWPEVEAKMESAATNYKDGRATGFETVARYESADLACIAEIERFEAKVGGSDELTSVALRVTSIFRPEDGAWKLVHRHADPITTSRSAQSVIQP